MENRVVNIWMRFLFCLVMLVCSISISFSQGSGGSCEEAVDYGVVNGLETMSGSLDESDAYWISFTSSCDFRNFVISTCDSHPNFDTYLHVYESCEDFNPDDLNGSAWFWNDDPGTASPGASGEECDSSSLHAEINFPEDQSQIISAGTYYVRVSGYQASFGDWNLSVIGLPLVYIDAGEDQVLELEHDGVSGGEMDVTLDASLTTCPDQIVNYAWTEDGEIISESSTEAIQTVSLSEGEHDISLSITDLLGLQYQSSLNVSISEPNSSPVSNGGGNVVLEIPHNNSPDYNTVDVILDGSASNDPENDDLLYNWVQTSGPDIGQMTGGYEAMSPWFVAINNTSENIIYEFDLTVTDPYGLESISSNVYTIMPEPNTPPVANAGGNQQIQIPHDGDPNTIESEIFTLNAFESLDEDNDPLQNYKWFEILSDGNQLISNSQVYTGTFEGTGEHNFLLYLEDVYGASDEDQMTLTVLEEPNEAPVVQFDPYPAEFTLNPDDNPGGEQVVLLSQFDASFDPDSTNGVMDGVEKVWTDENGNEVFDMQILEEGEHSFILTVTDVYGASTSNTLLILIHEPNQPPVVYAGNDMDINEFDSVILVGSVSDENNSIQDMTLSWSSNYEGANISDASQLQPVFTAPEVAHNDYPTDIEFTLTAVDPFGAEDFDVTLVTVHNLNAPPLISSANEIDINEDSEYTLTINDIVMEDLDDCIFIDGECDGYVSEEFMVVISDNESQEFGNYTFTNDLLIPGEDFSGTLEVNIQVSDLNDENNLSETIIQTINVLAVNDAPVLQDFSGSLPDPIYEDSSFSLSLSSFVYSDVEQDVGDLVLYIAETENYFYDYDNEILYLGENFFGELDILVQIDDGQEENNLSDALTIPINVVGINDSPSLVLDLDENPVLQDMNFDEDFIEIQLNLENYFEDVDGDEISYDLLSSDDTIFESSVNDGVLILTSILNQNSVGALPTELTFTVSDNVEGSEPLVASIDIEINPINDAPIANLTNEGVDVSQELYQTEQDTPIEIDLNLISYDPEGDNISFVIDSYPEDGTLDIESGIVTYTPNPSYVCFDSFTYIPSDAELDGDAGQISLSIGYCNHQPVITNMVFTENVQEDNLITISANSFVVEDLDICETLNDENSCNESAKCNWEDEFCIDVEGDGGSVSSISYEIWPGDNYYLQNGHCAWENETTGVWTINETLSCGLVSSIDECFSGNYQENIYNDGTIFCGCSNIEDQCVASSIISTTDFSVMPAQDYDEELQVTIYANDGELQHNLSDPFLATVYITPINDLPVITQISDQIINEDDILTLTFEFDTDDDERLEADFIISDVDNSQDEIQFIQNDLPGVYYQSYNMDEGEFYVTFTNGNWNGFIDEMVVSIVDSDATDICATAFSLDVLPINDPPTLESIGLTMENQNGELIIFEDTSSDLVDEVYDIYIRYTDPDADADINENPEESQMMENIDWTVSSLFDIDGNDETESNITFSLLGDGSFDSLLVDGSYDYYYIEQIYLQDIEPDWNGSEIIEFSDGDNSVSLTVQSLQQNDAPLEFLLNNDIVAYQNNPNNFYLLEDESLYYYRFPVSEDLDLDFISDEIPEGEQAPENIRFIWDSTDDVDLSATLNAPDNLLELYYRIELVSSDSEDIIVLADAISDTVVHGNIMSFDINFLQPFFTYNSSSDFYDYCGESIEVTDSTHSYIDYSGGTEYQWRVSAYNNWCDTPCSVSAFELPNSEECTLIGSDPSTNTEFGETSFAVDLTLPEPSISLLLDDLSPEYFDLYLMFDEELDSDRSHLYVYYSDDVSYHSKLDEELQMNDTNVYLLTSRFDGTGVTEFSVQSWDKVGNGVLSTLEVTYDEILPNLYTSIYSPTEDMMLSCSPGVVDKLTSVLIQENDYQSRIDVEDYVPVSPVYSVKSPNIDILGNINYEIKIPDYMEDKNPWRYRIFMISSNGFNDITSEFSDNRIIGSTNSIGDFVLFYNAEAEEPIPNKISLLSSFPNPFNPATVIEYNVIQSGYVKIDIVNLVGQRVKTLVEDYSLAGYHQVVWDGTDEMGISLGSGIYFIRAQIGKEIYYHKMMKIK